MLDAVIIFAPVGPLVPQALRTVAKGGTVVCAGIHMSDIPQFAYELLWGERRICSVANLTRQDAIEFIELAPTIPIQTSVLQYPLHRANEALATLRAGTINGAAVLTMMGDIIVWGVNRLAVDRSPHQGRRLRSYQEIESGQEARCR
jgi:propanol-preferring alcohol dehydrogenase